MKLNSRRAQAARLWPHGFIFGRAPLLCLGTVWLGSAPAATTNDFFGIHVVDERTGRGVPLVELETVNHLKFLTDSAGWVALSEPAWKGQRIFFHVRSHGYQFPRDGFGFRGVALPVQAGQRTTLKLQRLNVAERLYRVTGEGLYRDSVLLGEPTPLAEPLGSGRVAGQDSVFGEPYRGRIFWFWGDTLRLSYPLGHFWMGGATSGLPGQGGLDPARGINLRYFTDPDGFSRPVARLGVDQGPVWADGFLVLPDGSGRDRLVCRYAHMASLEKMIGHGLAVFDDDKEEFTKLLELDLRDRWRFPAQAHPFRHREGGLAYFYLGEVFPTVRFQADWKHYLDPQTYEFFTCLDSAGAPDQTAPARSTHGQLRYEWKRQTRPVDGAMEQKWVAAGKMKPEETRFLPLDVDSGQPIVLHRGSVRWNAFRQRWVMIAGQLGGASNLGEIWYAEASEPTGPWRRAKKIVTHDRYSFYNPVHHPFFDQEGGRTIYFEGTYTEAFSGNPVATPRYDYNQIMYRLDLDDPRLAPAR